MTFETHSYKEQQFQHSQWPFQIRATWDWVAFAILAIVSVSVHKNKFQKNRLFTWKSQIKSYFAYCPSLCWSKICYYHLQCGPIAMQNRRIRRFNFSHLKWYSNCSRWAIHQLGSFALEYFIKEDKIHICIHICFTLLFDIFEFRP